ncbi:molybdopterin-dependent oxidoreductase [Microvirga terrae]|uniref:Molybdopterin-dependent oxidoreductase n=2 Tax=Methylobacteriaceae TaxID=119045 RepID=A0ABY5RUK8_9HYPH|nr:MULTISPECIES: molybdopterin-dependent oxidoreductase [Microvirga]MBQ0820906.1 molybdopterin-dependent oxidoreductase [Microvirga sp. HBU67558]UVF19644.1 molybdopterin-dependent oxidoreductase [Microvirga terrae]
MLGAKMRTGLLGTLIAFLGIIGAAYAASLAVPKERPILTITGKIGVTNKDNTAQFDRAMLESLGLVTIETTTPWYDGKVKFEGVSLDKLMKQVEAKGERVSVIALNDYATEIPMADFAKFNVILALKRDGEYMPVRDKGPLFIVYPYDSNPELKTQTYYARSAWQVAKIEVK